MRLLLSLLFLASASACAQPSADTSTNASLLTKHQTVLTPSVGPEASGESDAETTVRAIIEQDGVHVVHFWAPWCGNSMNELRSGMYEMIDDHPDVSFSFVAIRNGGEDGAETLARFGLSERVEILAHPGGKPVSFLGRPVTWTPTTWIFNRNGTLAYAFNYGEVSPALLTQAIADAKSDWHHD